MILKLKKELKVFFGEHTIKYLKTKDFKNEKYSSIFDLNILHQTENREFVFVFLSNDNSPSSYQ